MARAFLALALTMVGMKVYAEVSINFSSTAYGINQKSNGAPLDNSFTFELGTFDNDFVPTAANIDSWESNWVRVSDASGAPLSNSSTTYGTINSFLGDYDGFASTVDLDHNNSPFEVGQQGYVWGYDRLTPGENEWVLFTNDSLADGWTFPVGTGDLSFAETWDVASANNAILGDINFIDDKNAEISLETAGVNVGAPPVPEPSTALILGAGVAFLGLRRKRS